MDVTEDAVRFLAHHQAHLAVDFVADQAIDHMHAGLFELAAPLDVVGFIEAGPQLHHRRDLFTVAGRFHQRADNPGIAARAIESLLDGQHAGVAGGFFQELHHRIETLVGMVQENIAPANGGEQIAFPRAQPGDGAVKAGRANGWSDRLRKEP